MSDEIPADARQRIDAAIAEFQAAVIDADIAYIGTDADYVPDSPRLQKQMGKYEEEHHARNE